MRGLIAMRSDRDRTVLHLHDIVFRSYLDLGQQDVHRANIVSVYHWNDVTVMCYFVDLD